MAAVLDRPSQIALFQLKTCLAALSLEIKGLRSSRGSVAPFIRTLLKSKTHSKIVLAIELDRRIQECNEMENSL